MKLPREVEQKAVREVFQHRQRMKDYEGNGDWAVIKLGAVVFALIVVACFTLYSVASLFL